MLYQVIVNINIFKSFICANLVEIYYYDVSKRLQNLNQIILKFSMEDELGEKSRENLIDQLGENQPINIL